MKDLIPWIQHIQHPLVLAGFALAVMAGLSKRLDLGKTSGQAKGELFGKIVNRVFVLALLIIALGLGQSLLPKPAEQAIRNNTGTAVNAAAGDVNITTCKPSFGEVNAPVKIECGPGIPPAALAKLEAYLTEQLRSSRNLNDLVDKQRQEIADWEKRYREQTQNLAEALALMPNDQLLQAAQLALQAGDLERAAQLREQWFQQWEEKTTAKLAAEAYQLAYKPLQALPYLKKAYRYQPGDLGYGYALALQKQKQRQCRGGLSRPAENRPRRTRQARARGVDPQQSGAAGG